MSGILIPDRLHLIEEERLIIRHSGELPEVAYHGTLYHLAADPEGPGITLSATERKLLRDEVIERYRTIILRDLNPELREKRAYRGIARSVVNWTRLNAFCAREETNAAHLREEFAEALHAFLQRECADVRGGRPSSVNCPSKDIEAFANSLGLSPESLPEGWQDLASLFPHPL